MQWNLFHAVDMRRQRHSEQIQQRRSDVHHMIELPPGLALRPDPVGPADQQGGANTAPVGVALVAFERRVARHGPAERVMVVSQGSADVVETRQILLDAGADTVPGALMVVGSVGAAQGAGAVVGNGDHDRVVALAEGVDLLKQSADLRIGVIDEPRIDLFLPRGQPLFVGVEFVPDLHPRIPGSQALIGR